MKQCKYLINSPDIFTWKPNQNNPGRSDILQIDKEVILSNTSQMLITWMNKT